MTSLARAERLRLTDLALAVGEDAPTLCGDWSAKDLVVHLLVRERSALGSAGIVLSPLSALTDLESARYAKQDFPVLVERLRGRGITPVAIPAVDRVVNTLEFFVHHEDIRRAQPGWEPRVLDGSEKAALWRAIKTAGRGLVRPAGVPVTMRRTDTGDTAVLRRGPDPVTIAGEVAELVLFLFGRAQTRGLTFEGPDTSISSLQSARLGL